VTTAGKDDNSIVTAVTAFCRANGAVFGLTADSDLNSACVQPVGIHVKKQLMGGAAPVVEKTAPVVEEAAPVVEEAAPVAEKTAPVAENTAPVVENAAPLVEEAAAVPAKKVTVSKLY